MAFQDTPADYPHYELATVGAVGAVYGLAYNVSEHAVYAAAFHKRTFGFGPGGPGAIYRIDLETRAVSHWATVPNPGEDHHALRVAADRAAAPWAGKTSLGDVDISPDGHSLFVVNLNDRRIYRFDVPSGRLSSDFPSGAATEPWAQEARPFGLAIRGTRLYHGVVRSGSDLSEMEAVIYSSNFDGTGMRAVARFGFDYPRGTVHPVSSPRNGISLAWRKWTDNPDNLVPPPHDAIASLHPMPELSDIDFDGAGDLIAGLRDRALDMFPIAYVSGPDRAGLGAGDTLRGTPSGNSWSFNLVEFFDDRIENSDESTMGALAHVARTDDVVATGIGGRFLENRTVYWYAADSGDRTRHEDVCLVGVQPRVATRGRWPLNPTDNESQGDTTVGDLEVLCAPPSVPTETPSPSLTPSPSPSPTNSPTASQTASATASPMSTITPRPGRIFLPLVLSEEPCAPTQRHADVALVLDASSSMEGPKLAAAKAAAKAFVAAVHTPEDQVAIISFNETATLEHRLSGDGATLRTAIDRITSAPGTRIDRGLAVGANELGSVRHRADRTAAMVLLTDGVQYEEPERALEVAAAARSAGVVLYAIGLGPDVDDGFMIEVADSRSRYFFAPTASDLEGIYEQVAKSIPCPPSTYWGRRP